jgi:hypothetical protein
MMLASWQRRDMPSKRRRRIAGSVLAAFALASACMVQQKAFSKTPYETQLAGVIYAIVQTLVTGEFAGRSRSHVDAPPKRRICKPDDFVALTRSALDDAAMDDFRRLCRPVESSLDATHAISIAYLPKGYCGSIKKAFETILEEQVFGAAIRGDILVVEYKGARFEGSGRDLLKQASLQATCEPDGSLRITGPRRGRR